MNAEAGILAQRAYIAASAYSLGCGVLLGFDAHKVSNIVGLDESIESPLLLFLIGQKLSGTTKFDFSFF